MAGTRINYTTWFLRILTWDGVLPLVLFGVPHLIRWLFPEADFDNAKGAIIALPVAALFVRLLIGCYYINSNHCPEPWRSRQQLSLVFGIFLLSFSDIYMAVFILDRQQGQPETEFYMLQLSLVVFGLAFPFLVFAMYPGREPVPSTTIGNWEVECQPLN